MAEASKSSGRLLFLRGYSENLAQALFRGGDLFLMPSSFEPCGIGQMVAMRESQPCVVHAVGGLRDTVRDGENGFTFSGATLIQQADGFANAVERAAKIFFENRPVWERVRSAAGAERFSWDQSAAEYIERMYT